MLHLGFRLWLVTLLTICRRINCNDWLIGWVSEWVSEWRWEKYFPQRESFFVLMLFYLHLVAHKEFSVQVGVINMFTYLFSFCKQQIKIFNSYFNLSLLFFMIWAWQYSSQYFSEKKEKAGGLLILIIPAAQKAGPVCFIINRELK